MKNISTNNANEHTDKEAVNDLTQTNKESEDIAMQDQKQISEVQEDHLDIEQLQDDLKSFLEAYYDGDFVCSSEAAFDYYRRLRMNLTLNHFIKKAGEEQLRADHKTIRECMELLDQEYTGNHNEAKQKIDACLDRYLPGLRAYRESVMPPVEDDTAETR